MEQNIQSSGLGSSSTEDLSRRMPDIAALTRAMVKGDEMAYRTFHDAYFDRLLRYLKEFPEVWLVRHGALAQAIAEGAIALPSRELRFTL